MWVDEEIPIETRNISSLFTYKQKAKTRSYDHVSFKINYIKQSGILFSKIFSVIELGIKTPPNL